MEQRREGSANEYPTGGLAAVWRALGYLRSYKAEATGAFVALILSSAASLATPQLIRVAIDEGIAPRRLQVILLAVGGLVGAALLRGLFQFLQGYLAERASQGVAYDLRKDLGTDHDERKREKRLGYDGLRRRRRPEAPQRETLGNILQRATRVEGAPDVVGVGCDQEGSEPNPHIQGQLYDPGARGHGEEDQEDAHVAGDGHLVDYHVFARGLAPGVLVAHARLPAPDLHPLLPALAVADRGRPGHEHSQGRQQKRRA